MTEKEEMKEMIEEICNKVKQIKNPNKLLDVLDYVDGKLEEDKMFPGVKK